MMLSSDRVSRRGVLVGSALMWLCGARPARAQAAVPMFKWTIAAAGLELMTGSGEMEPDGDVEAAREAQRWRGRYGYAEGYVQAPILQSVAELESRIRTERGEELPLEERNLGLSVQSGRALLVLHNDSLSLPRFFVDQQDVIARFFGGEGGRTIRFFAASLQWQRDQHNDVVLTCAGVLTFRGIGRRSDLNVRLGRQGLVGELEIDQRRFLSQRERENSESLSYRVGDQEILPTLRCFVSFTPRVGG